jgi:3-oxoacyl-(acyl-carrier-protein) synthase
VNRVVITGLGAVTPLGLTVGPYWESLKAGKSGLGPLTLPVEAETLLQKIGGEVKGFDPAQHLDEREIPQLDRVSQFAIVAARAVRHRL